MAISWSYYSDSDQERLVAFCLGISATVDEKQRDMLRER